MLKFIRIFLNKKNTQTCYRLLLSFFIFMWEKIKRLIKFIYQLVAILLRKTISIKKLIKRGEASSEKIFEGHWYCLPEKNDINNQRFKYVPFGKYYVPEYFIYIIKNAFIQAGTNNIFSSRGKRITDINFQKLPFDYKVIFKHRNLDFFYIKGTLLILGIGEIEKNYSHVWTEFAARAYATKLSKIKYDYILVDSDSKFLQEILKLIGLPLKKVICSKKYKYIKAKKLIYPELISNFKEYYLNGIHVYHRKYLPSWLNSLYQDVSKNIKSSNLNIAHKKIYISRKNKRERRIINEINLISTLDKLGFKVIYFEDYTVSDQIKIVKNATQIIGIHGAGFVNINFCRKATNILELFPFYYQCAFFYMHARECGLKYDFYIGKTTNKIWKKSPIMEDFYVDTKIIKDFIESNWN